MKLEYLNKLQSWEFFILFMLALVSFYSFQDHFTHFTFYFVLFAWCFLPSYMLARDEKLRFKRSIIYIRSIFAYYFPRCQESERGWKCGGRFPLSPIESLVCARKEMKNLDPKLNFWSVIDFPKKYHPLNIFSVAFNLWNYVGC